MIRSFRCEETRAIFEGGWSRRFARIAAPAERKLNFLHIAHSLADLAAIPGNRLEALRGDSIAFASMISTASAFGGAMAMHTTWRSSTTIRGNMAAKYRLPEHPGLALKEEVIDELEMSIRQFATALRVPPNRLSQIITGKRAISADTSLRLARYLGCSPDFWLNLQAHYELELAKRQSLNRIRREVKPRSQSAAA